MEEDITLSEYNSNPCLSFPLKSGFAYKTTNFNQFVESNSFLVESQANEFSIKKFKDLGMDLTVCFQFKNERIKLISDLNGSKCAQSYRRSPALSHLIFELVQNLDMDGLYLDSAVDKILFEEILGEGLELISPNERRWNLLRTDVAKDFIHGNYQTEIGIDEMADASCLSRFHFTRTFKQRTGLSPYEYLLAVRLHKARELLKKDQSITEIAFATGFNSLENFSQTFKNTHGLAPSEFRDQLRKVY